MKIVRVEEVTAQIKEMCIEANHFLSEDMQCALAHATSAEKNALGRQILGQLQENLQIAGEDMIPICQDTGMAVVFAEIGQEVHFEGGSLEEAIHEGEAFWIQTRVLKWAGYPDIRTVEEYFELIEQ